MSTRARYVVGFVLLLLLVVLVYVAAGAAAVLLLLLAGVPWTVAVLLSPVAALILWAAHYRLTYRGRH